jgi:hypothetical protein
LWLPLTALTTLPALFPLLPLPALLSLLLLALLSLLLLAALLSLLLLAALAPALLLLLGRLRFRTVLLRGVPLLLVLRGALHGLC